MSRTWPESVKNEWLDEREVRESGLLAYINRTVLWPLGMALAVTYDRDTDKYTPGLRILRNQPFDPIVGDGDETAETREANMRHFAEWLAARLGGDTE